MPRQAASSYGLPVIPGERPEPPDGLSEPELEIWHELVDGLPAERIDPAFVVLARVLVQHIRYCRFWGEAAERMLEEGTLDDPARVKVLRTFLRAHGEQSEKIGTLMTRLRMTPQSRVRADKAALQRPTGLRPWEDWQNPTDDDEEEPQKAS